MTLNVPSLRADTPGCQHVTHLDCASRALLPTPVIESMRERTRLESSPGIGDSQISRGMIRHGIARLIGAESGQIALTPNGSFGWIQAINGIRFAPGGVILASRQEFQTNCAAILRVCAERRLSLRLVPNDPDGKLSLEALGNLIDSKVVLLCVTHMPANSGIVNPVSAIGKVAREASIPWILDACQSIGQLPLNVHELSCDFLVATGRKYLRAPGGTGFLYVSQTTGADLAPAYSDYGGIAGIGPGNIEYRPGARRYEMHSLSGIGLAGLHTAVRYATAIDLSAAWTYIRHLTSLLVTELAHFPVSLYNSDSADHSGIVSIGTASLKAKAVREQLLSLGYVTGLARHTSTPFEEGRPDHDQLRVSVHYYNTEQDILNFCGALGRILNSG